MLDPTPIVLVLLGMTLGGAGVWYAFRRFKARVAKKPFRDERIVTQTIAERVNAVGKLVALEVCAKEITTASAGVGWLPPLILSQARLAMIFHFEKQYSLDLSLIRPEDVSEIETGRFRVRLPEMDGALRLIDMTPYDIQSARILGLLDLIPMTADRQRDLMKKAQTQAASIFEHSDKKYLQEARVSAERHVRALLEMIGVKVEFEWPAIPQVAAAVELPPSPIPEVVKVKPRLVFPITLQATA